MNVNLTLAIPMCVAHINHRVNDYVVIKYGSAEQELFSALNVKWRRKRDYFRSP